MKYWQYTRKIEHLQSFINSNNKDIEQLKLENKRTLSIMIDLKKTQLKKNLKNK